MDQSARNRQHCALAENQTAGCITIYRQISMDGHIALNDVEFAAKGNIIVGVRIKDGAFSIEPGSHSILTCFYNIAIFIKSIRVGCFSRLRRPDAGRHQAQNHGQSQKQTENSLFHKVPPLCVMLVHLCSARRIAGAVFLKVLRHQPKPFCRGLCFRAALNIQLV